MKVDKTVTTRLALQRPGLVEQEIKLLYFSKLLQQLHQVVPAWIQAQGIRQDRPMCYIILKAIPCPLHKFKQ